MTTRGCRFMVAAVALACLLCASEAQLADTAPRMPRTGLQPLLDLIEESARHEAFQALKREHDPQAPKSQSVQVTDSAMRYVYPLAPEEAAFLQLEAAEVAEATPSSNDAGAPGAAQGNALTEDKSPIYVLPTLPLQIPNNVLMPQGSQSGMGARINAAQVQGEAPPIDNAALAQANNIPMTPPQGAQLVQPAQAPLAGQMP